MDLARGVHNRHHSGQSANEEVEATSAASETYNLGSAADDDHRGHHSNSRAYKFQPKFNRPFLEGEGPSDAANS